MKTTILMLCMLTTSAFGSPLDDYLQGYPRLGQSADYGYNSMPRPEPMYPPTPSLPSMVERYNRPRPASDAGYNFMSPTQTCHSDGQNTFCFPR